MKRKATLLAIVTLLALTAPSTHAGRPDKNWKSWFGHFGGGYTMVQGDYSDLVEDGWNLNGGATYWPEAWPIGIDLELAYNELGIDSSALRELDAILDGVDTGSFSVGSLTASAVWGPQTDGPIGFYITAGVGGYRVEASVGESVLYEGIICDPIWWWCYPGIGTGTAIKASETQTVFGYNVGVGVDFKIGLGSQIYVEAKYHSADTDPKKFEYLPLVVGYRW